MMICKLFGIVVALATISCSVSAQTGGLPVNISSGVSRVGSGVALSGQQPAQQTPAKEAVKSSTKPLATGKTAPSPMPSPFSGVNLVNEAIDQAAPLSPDEVRSLRRELESRKAALTENVSGKPPVKPTTAIHNLDLSPGATPPVVRVEVGHGTIVSFLDAAGRPWPIKVVDNFSPNTLTHSQFTEHQISIGANSLHPINAGIAVALDEIPVAVTFSVISGQPEVDTQIHMVLPLYRHGAPPGVGSLRGEPSLTAGDLMAYLLRTPPPGARQLVVEGQSGAMAWQVGPDRMVLRTTLIVTTGAFRVQGIGDGTFAYEMPLTPQVRVVQGDRFSTIRVSGFLNGGV